MADAPQPLVPKHPVNACCRENDNLGPFERLPDPDPITDDVTGEKVPMLAGWRRCNVCQRRHYFARRKDRLASPDH